MRRERSWTEEQLRDAVASSTSFRAVLRALGLKNGSLAYIQRCISERELPTAHFATTSRFASTDERLREIVASSSSLTEVLRALGLELHSSNFHRCRRRIKLLGIDTSHFPREPRTRMRRTRWGDDELRAAAAASTSLAQAIRSLGLVPAGGNYDHIQRRIRDLAIDTSHFNGKGWNVGGKFRPRPETPLEELLVSNRWATSHHLKTRLFRAGVKTPACEQCGWAERSLDGRIPVELDHINGDRNDNRLENLRILCPNCHSLQLTHRGLNQRRRKNN